LPAKSYQQSAISKQQAEVKAKVKQTPVFLNLNLNLILLAVSPRIIVVYSLISDPL
jgi:hypothetical protein